MFESVRLEPTPHFDLQILACLSDREVSHAEPGEVQDAARRKEFEAKPGQMTEAFPLGGPRTILLGLGEKSEQSDALLRTAAAALFRRLAVLKQTHVLIRAETMSDPLVAGRIFGEAAVLLSWPSGIYKSQPSAVAPLHIWSNDESFRRGFQFGLQLGESVNLARTLAQTPPNIATPSWMAAQAKDLADQSGLSYRVIEGPELLNERMTGLVEVGRASINPPCLIRLEYSPATPTVQRPLVLIGKTITYDTGGLSLKGKTSMPGMKGDKAGGCAVLGAMHAIATLIRPDFPVVALLAAAENSVSGDAYRPDDVITFRNGVTVEITNTDAEGRLVLADALCWAADLEDPAAILDLATLTGGVVVALGSEFAGYFCNDPLLAGDLQAASHASGDRLWRLPLDEAYKEMMKSECADLVNSNLNGKAHPVQGATFLWHFVKSESPWAHIDIAGVANSSSDRGCFVTGPTGFGVRLIADLIQGIPSVMA